jgi:hypothetical protein
MIAPLLRTSEPFHYHDRVVGDLWRQLSPAATNAPAGWATLLQAVEAARHSLHLASPLLAGAAFTDAVVRVLGTHRLRVYVLTTDGLAPAFDAQQKEAHAAALAKLSAAGAILQSTSQVHAQFLVIDAGEPSAQALVCPAGLPTPETDTPVLTLPQHARPLQEAFALAWWRLSVERLTKQGPAKAEPQPQYPIDRPIDGLAVNLQLTAKPKADAPARLEITPRIKAVLEPSQRRLWCTVPQPETQAFLVEALLAKAAAGIDVRLLTSHRPAATETLRKLALGGVKVRLAADIRATTLIADGEGLVLAVGTGAKDEKPGLELAPHLVGPATEAFATDFESAWAQALAELEPQAKLGGVTSPYQKVTAGPLGPWLPPPVESKVVALETPWIAASATDLASSPPHKDAKDDPACGALTLVYQWVVVPPKLPADVKEEFMPAEEAAKLGLPAARAPYDPRRFSRGKELYLLAERNDPIYLGWLRQVAAELKARVVIPRG